MTITLSAWVLPLAVTLAVFAWAVVRSSAAGGDYSFDLMPLVRFAVAIVLSLMAWLVWALLR
jgi:hypothetical protein